MRRSSQLRKDYFSVGIHFLIIERAASTVAFSALSPPMLVPTMIATFLSVASHIKTYHEPLEPAWVSTGPAEGFWPQPQPKA